MALLAGPSHGAPPDSAAFDVVGGGSARGAWAVGLQGGWPWFEARAQVGLAKGWTPLLEVESALFRRWHASVGISRRMLDHPRRRITLEALLGWQVQTGVLAQRGPSGVFRMRALGLLGRVSPWVTLGGRHTLLFDRTRTLRAEGTTTRFGARYRFSPQISTGLVVGLTPSVGVDVGIDWHFVDVQTTAVSLPGIHLGLQLGAGR